MSFLLAVAIVASQTTYYEAKVTTFGCTSIDAVSQLQKVRSDQKAFQAALAEQQIYGQCVAILQGTVVEGSIETTDAHVRFPKSGPFVSALSMSALCQLRTNLLPPPSSTNGNRVQPDRSVEVNIYVLNRAIERDRTPVKTVDPDGRAKGQIPRSILESTLASEAATGRCC